MQRKIIAAALFALFATPIEAQGLNPSTPIINGAPGFTASNPGNITGSFSATLSGFTPGMTFATLTAAATSGSIALPAGTVVAFQNTGTTTVSCTLGTGSATALANEIQVPASSTVFVTVGSNTWGACIDQSGSTSNLVVLAGGSGLGTGFGGGGSGGGGGGTVTQGPAGASAWLVTGTGGTFPATQSGAWTVQPGNTANTTPWLVTANLGTLNGAATSANQTTEIGSLATIATNSALPLPAQSTHTVDIGAVDQVSPYPAGATPITASATGTTAATTATLAGTTGKTTYICGYSIRANATAATTVTNTITGVITATLSSVMWVAPAASGLGVDEQIFNPCIPASGTNQPIAIVSGAPGTGGTVSAKGWGFQQ